MRVGCFQRNTAPCQVGPAGRIFNVVYGAKVTVSDPTPPATASVEAPACSPAARATARTR